MVLKHFILPVEHFKANLFFSHYDPPNPPITHPCNCRDGDTKRGDVGLIKVKKKVDFKIHLMWFSAHVFSIKVPGWVGPEP